MLVRRMVSCSVVALLAGSAGGAAAMEGAAAVGIPLAQEMVADEKPPPSRASSPLADIPLRTRFPSRTFLPGLPDVGFADPASSLADTDETQLVQLVYDTYSRYSEREDGERVEFELDGFRTVYKHQFATVLHYPDLMTLGTDWEIDTTIHENRHNDEEPHVWYEAEWVPVQNRAESPAAEQLLGKSVLDILALGSDEQPARRRTVAITSYRVRVSFLGRTKSYRAAVRWRIGEDRTVEFSVTDNVVPEVGWAIGERFRPTSSLESPEPELPFETATAASTTLSCVSQTWSTVYSTQQARYDYTEHTSGKHEGVFIGQYDCSCDSSCTSYCDPGHYVEACQDYGDLNNALLVHRTTKKRPGQSGTSSQGHQEAARCASALGCFVQSCFDGACESISVSVNGGVFGFTFSTDTATILDAQLSNSHLCGLCTETDPPEDDPGEITTFDQGGGGTDPSGGGDEPADGSPIVIDLDRGGFRFTDLAGGVRFDLDGDGRRERLSWLAPGSGDAWLALDRDGDGAITTGAELFGNFTPQPPSAAPHGFLALAVFDTAAEGGDGDGRITAGDAVFAALRLWLDGDHDGASRPEELLPLAAAGVAAIDLAHVESRRRDRHGNELRYTSRVELDDAATSCTDVFLLRRD